MGTTVSDFSKIQFSWDELVYQNVHKCLNFMNIWFAQKFVVAALGEVRFDVNEHNRTFSLFYNGNKYENINYPEILLSDKVKTRQNSSDKDIEFFKENRVSLRYFYVLVENIWGLLEKKLVDEKAMHSLNRVSEVIETLLERYDYENREDGFGRPKEIHDLSETIEELEQLLPELKTIEKNRANDDDFIKSCLEDLIKTLELVLKWFIYIQNRTVTYKIAGTFLAPEEDSVKDVSLEKAYSRSVITMYMKTIFNSAKKRDELDQYALHFARVLGHELFHSIHYLLCKCNCQGDIELWRSSDGEVSTVLETLATLFEFDWCKFLYANSVWKNESSKKAIIYVKDKLEHAVYPSYPYAGAKAFWDTDNNVKYTRMAELFEESLWSFKEAFKYLEKVHSLPLKSKAQTYNWTKRVKDLRFDPRLVIISGFVFDIEASRSGSLELIFIDPNTKDSTVIKNPKLVYRTVVSLKRSLIKTQLVNQKVDLFDYIEDKVSLLKKRLGSKKVLFVDKESLMPMDRTFLPQLYDAIAQSNI